jgi:hypothetical protein
MDTSAIALLGQQLTDFLVKQFAPPPGTKTSLGFLGTGLAVDPNSFLSGSQFNPALVNKWLDIVVDPLGEVITSSDQVEFTPWTATQLLEAIYGQAMSLAPPDSDAQHGFAKAKSQAMEGLGGATIVSTAPLDWYDPARVAQWPTCNLTASSTSSSGTMVTLGEPPPAKPLWAWRSLETMPIDYATVNFDAVLGQLNKKIPPAQTGVPTIRTINTIQDRRLAFAATPIVAATQVASPIMSARLAPLGQAAGTAQAVQLSRVSTESPISIDRIPASVIIERPVTAAQGSERAVTAAQALMVSQAVSSAANRATTSSVATNSLSLGMKYQVVSLSRAPWWNEFLMLLNNWYVPGVGRASMIEDSDAQKVIGVPIALILTSDVSIEANWSESDRAAATSNTHFGAWALNSAQFTSTSSRGVATLAIPGIQAIACIYRQLPALPPQADPNLPVPSPPSTAH